jgi:hypothetical protein
MPPAEKNRKGSPAPITQYGAITLFIVARMAHPTTSQLYPHLPHLPADMFMGNAKDARQLKAEKHETHRY